MRHAGPIRRQRSSILARPPHPQRLEHGPSGLAAGRSYCSQPIPIWRCRNWSRKSAKHKAARVAECARDVGQAAAGFHRRANRAALAQGARATRPVTYTHLPLSWDDTWVTFRHPLDYVGSRRRRRRWRRPRHFRRRGAGAQRLRPPADCDLRRRRLSHGRRPRCGRRRITRFRCCSCSPTIAHSIMTKCTRSGWRACATARSRTSGSASACREPEVDLAAMGRAQGAVGFGPITKTGRSRAGARKGDRRGRTRPGRRRRCARRAGLYRRHDAAMTRAGN